MSELDKLFKALQEMRSESSLISNSKEVWSAIGQRDFTAAGFANEEEAMAWIENNPYSNL
jgi:hypothetical protein